MTGPVRLADAVRARTNDTRIDRQWAALEQAGLPGPAGAGAGQGRLRIAIATAVASAALAAGTALWVMRTPGDASIGSGSPAQRRGASAEVGAMVESAQAPVSVQLEDGSRVELAPRARLRLVKNGKREVLLELRGGKARFAVAHDRSRPFVIDAGGAQVRVVGTRFELGRSRQAGGEQLDVSVSEGVVEVRRAGERDVRRLRAGERWSALLPIAAQGASAGGANADQAVPQLNGQDRIEPPAAELAADEPTEPAASVEPALDPGEAEAEAASANVPGSGPRAAAARERAAARIFERANLARRAGRMQDAADAYAELLARFPRDRRAGLSAFELGRIRMDALHDASGAIAALERAAAAGENASFHEDALARMVVAYDAEGRSEACRKARDRYLARYPDGVHAHVLAGRCR